MYYNNLQTMPHLYGILIARLLNIFYKKIYLETEKGTVFMRLINLSLTIFTISLFLMACGSSQTDETVYTDQNPDIVAENEIYPDDTEYVAKDNLDLEAVGELLQKAKNAEDFEYLLNNEDGINNLDLNGDGYTDYLSVAEYDDDNYDNQRGFTLFDRFGPDEIQEVASIIFDRDRADAPGARVLLRGNEQIYGDDNYYETNWLEKSLAIAGSLFGNHNDRYESPYSYDNYPENYEPYRVVETPVYRTRVREYYPERVFIRTNNPTITNIRIQSPYRNKSINKIYAKLAKPNRDQIEFRRNNPRRPEFVEIKNGKIKYKKLKDDSFERKESKKDRKNYEKFDKKLDKKNKEKFDKRADEEYKSRNLPNRSGRQNFEPNKKEKYERKNEKPEKNMKKENKEKDRRGKENKKGDAHGKKH